MQEAVAKAFGESDSTDPREHAVRIREMLNGVAEHARKDIDKIDDPTAEALFETAAEVLMGLSKAFEHFEGRSEKAFK